MSIEKKAEVVYSVCISLQKMRENMEKEKGQRFSKVEFEDIRKWVQSWTNCACSSCSHSDSYHEEKQKEHVVKFVCSKFGGISTELGFSFSERMDPKLGYGVNEMRLEKRVRKCEGFEQES